ncbi:carboxymuconolactone decarboxylase family protein [Jiangella rhizosphaerae]|uniref:Carboxymuconolactone decarboxylase family protein n=1 Tax=Jiangella rhizosphaerae TaxID=2293569 RepID=A0A418KVA2_9ACTN|nr:carboxymuconolactone decarboxylase family protein [Jiangella rhizosphaerae]RIQ31241.1 carboxymuconolactone decarboxylase family protein [Jiangella rhizosphaerae]
MARISLAPKPTLGYRLVRFVLRRRYGVMLDPIAATAHQPRVMRTLSLLEAGAAKWRVLDRDLKALAILATSARTGCAWCMDFGYWESHHAGVEPAKLRAVTHWRDSDLYTALERRVMAYAEAMTATPPEVTDEMVAELRADLSEAELVELTATVALENLRNRSNAALGLTGQGFKDRCEVPAA